MTNKPPPRSGTSRRHFIKLAAGSVVGMACLPALSRSQPSSEGKGIALGFGLYGMKDLPTEKAIQMIADIGYDAVQLCLIPGWGCEPSKLTAKRRREIRRALDTSGLELNCLLEHIPLVGDDKEQEKARKRLRQAAELAHDLVPNRPPMIETVMGGKRWQDEKARFRDNLGRWAELAKSTRTVIAIKPHRNSACSRPEEAAWLAQQINSPWIRLVYDYSHFDNRDIPLEKSLATMMPYLAQIAVKDTEIRNGKIQFALPGTTGRIDFVTLLRQAYASGYRGEVNCEVSSHVHRAPGYDSWDAAKICYTNMERVLREAGIPRRKKEKDMPKVLMPVGDATEMMDTLYPFFRLPEDGFEVVVAGPEARLYNGVAHEVPPNGDVPWDITQEQPAYHIEATIAFRDVDPKDYAGLFLSGGRAPEYLRYDKDLMRITKYFIDEKKPIAVVCHGIEILAAAGGLQGGRRATTVPKCELDITQCGGIYVDEPCVVDDNIVSTATWHNYDTEFFKTFIQKMRQA